MNRWSVYEYMKHRYERTGEIPKKGELEVEFSGIDLEELEEGIQEFITLVPNSCDEE